MLTLISQLKTIQKKTKQTTDCFYYNPHILPGCEISSVKDHDFNYFVYRFLVFTAE